MQLEFDLKPALDAIREKKAKTVVVQIPEGLKTRARELAEEIEEKTGAVAITLVDPIFGACMLAEQKAIDFGADLLIHFGHSRFYREKVPTVYVPLYYPAPDKRVAKIAKKLAVALKKNKIASVGLVCVVQYRPLMEKLVNELPKHGVKALIGRGAGTLDGQVLGCNYHSARVLQKQVDGFVFIGDGAFHPAGLVASVNKPVFTLDPFTKRIEDITPQKKIFLRKRFAQIALAENAKSFGILVSTEKGQFGYKNALAIKKDLELAGKKAFILAGDLLSPSNVLGIKVDAFVNTACPRIGIDDATNYKKPVLNPNEVRILLGQAKWEDYIQDEIKNEEQAKMQ